MTDTATAPQQLQVAGVTVPYRRQGQGEPVVYLHGKDFGAQWLPFHDRLAATVDLMAPVFPGFGGTPMPAWLRGFDDAVLHQRDLLDALGLDRAHLVGHDLGAWIATEFAVYYPHRVASLTLLAPFGLRAPGHPIADFFGSSPERNAELLFGPDPGPHAALLPQPGDIDSFVAGYADASAAARLMWNPRYDLQLDHRLPRLDIPALVVAAGDDRLVPAAHPRRWAELLRGSRIETIPGAPHALTVTDPERTAEVVSDFVRGSA